MSAMGRCDTGSLPLRDDAFEPKLGGGLKELGAIAIDMVAEMDR